MNTHTPLHTGRTLTCTLLSRRSWGQGTQNQVRHRSSCLPLAFPLLRGRIRPPRGAPAWPGGAHLRQVNPALLTMPPISRSWSSARKRMMLLLAFLRDPASDARGPRRSPGTTSKAQRATGLKEAPPMGRAGVPLARLPRGPAGRSPKEPLRTSTLPRASRGKARSRGDFQEAQLFPRVM